MNMSDELVNRFTSTALDSGISELQEHQHSEYQLIYNELFAKYLENSGEIPDGMDAQVINKIFTHNEENITPMGLVNVSLEYLAKVLTFAKSQGIQWQVDCKKCTDTHFKKLSHFNIIVDCHKEQFVTMAKDVGFRY